LKRKQMVRGHFFVHEASSFPEFQYVSRFAVRLIGRSFFPKFDLFCDIDVSASTLKWWSSADPLRWWWWPTPDSDATTGSVVYAIFEASERILKGPGTLHFPRMCQRMLEEVKRLAQNCLESTSMPLVKLYALAEAQGLHVLAGSHQIPQRLDAVKICSEIGILIHFKDFDSEDWVGVNLNFCLYVITYFTNNVMTWKATTLPQQSTYFLISKVLDYSPYIQASVVFISEPLVLIVALWGMTTPRMRNLFASAFPHSGGNKSRL
jgi:hypothetical protein